MSNVPCGARWPLGENHWCGDRPAENHNDITQWKGVGALQKPPSLSAGLGKDSQTRCHLN